MAESVRGKVMKMARLELVGQQIDPEGGVRVLAAKLHIGFLPNKKQAWEFLCDRYRVPVVSLYGWEKDCYKTRIRHDLPPRTSASRQAFNAFYNTKEWLKLRYQAFLKHGRKCGLCGATDRLHVDHIKPRSKFPELEYELDNLQILCEDCNFGKGGWDQTDWRNRNVKET